MMSRFGWGRQAAVRSYAVWMQQIPDRVSRIVDLGIAPGTVLPEQMRRVRIICLTTIGLCVVGGGSYQGAAREMTADSAIPNPPTDKGAIDRALGELDAAVADWAAAMTEDTNASVAAVRDLIASRREALV